MKIRSITFFGHGDYLDDPDLRRISSRLIKDGQRRFREADLEVQTLRLAASYFPRLSGLENTADIIKTAISYEEIGRNLGFGYVSLGPVMPAQTPIYNLIPEITASTEMVFSAGMMTSDNHKVHHSAVKTCAETICSLSTVEENGFANLRFGALANVPPGSPFFPASFGDGDQASFAIATESADIALNAVRMSRNLKEFRENLINMIEQNAHRIEKISTSLEESHNIKFSGIDFSLAPFPKPGLSFGEALTELGVSEIGKHGTLAGNAIIADALDQAEFQKVGFNGLFMTVLEDYSLGEAVSAGTLSIKDLLLYSTVCGTGLDTIPLPGDTTPEQIEGLLLDLSYLSLRLNKPLTARLMPIPGKNPGDMTDFDFKYFQNTRIMELESDCLGGLLDKDEDVIIKGRR